MKRMYTHLQCNKFFLCHDMVLIRTLPDEPELRTRSYMPHIPKTFPVGLDNKWPKPVLETLSHHSQPACMKVGRLFREMHGMNFPIPVPWRRKWGGGALPPLLPHAKHPANWKGLGHSHSHTETAAS